MNMHAYLIIAYNQWKLLEILMHLLDDKRNDIYLHIDINSGEVPIEKLKSSVLKSNVFVIERLPVYRGSYSLFDAEMRLLKAACKKNNYSYFHLLSGQDLPLRNQNFIHDFFDDNDGKNFLDVITPEHIRSEWYERVSLFQLLSRFSLAETVLSLPTRCIRRATIFLQRRVRINRFEKYEKVGFALCFGSNWFSITKPFAEYLIENENLIKQMFQKYTFAPEELIPQTFLWSSEFRETLYDSEELDHDLHRANMRLVFWGGKTSPETITMKHMDAIRSSTNLFARKFDYDNHPDVVEAVIDMVNSGGHSK